MYDITKLRLRMIDKRAKLNQIFNHREIQMKNIKNLKNLNFCILIFYLLISLFAILNILSVFKIIIAFFFVKHKNPYLCQI